MGSRAFAVCRSTLFAMRSSEDEDGYLLGNPKQPRPAGPTLTYGIQEVHVTDRAEGEIWTAKISGLAAEQSIRDALSDADAGEPAGSTQDADVVAS